MRPRILLRFICLLAIPALCGIAALARAAATEEGLLGALQGELSRPQLRCAWAAAHFDRADRTLSLYREELASLFVAIDGVRIADSATGGVLRMEFETRLFGPAAATVTVDTARSPAATKTAAGSILEIGFTDQRRGAHPLFCGVIAAIHDEAGARRAHLVALLPRAGREQWRSAEYTNLSTVDVLQRVAGDAGLPLEVQDSRTHPVQPLVARKAVADWPFMRQLAASPGLELLLRSDGTLLLTPGAFAPPAPPAPRSWTDLTWVEIAARLAAESGRALDAQLTGSYPRLALRQTTASDDFLVDLAVAQQASAWWTRDRLLLRADGAWSRNPAAQDAPTMTLTPLQLATLIARRNGLLLRAESLPASPVAVVRRQETDAGLLLRVLGTQGARLDSRSGVLYLRAAKAPGDVADLLARRIVIAGSANTARRFERRHGEPRAQILDPEGIATTEVLLDLGTALAPSASPATRLADASRIAVELEAALGRLAARPPAAPHSRFLQDFARTYRPTLIHLYRLRPDGADALRAIAAAP
jgi:hypothetical protein